MGLQGEVATGNCGAGTLLTTYGFLEKQSSILYKQVSYVEFRIAHKITTKVL
jgi:hypothetical protein